MVHACACVQWHRIVIHFSHFHYQYQMVNIQNIYFSRYKVHQSDDGNGLDVTTLHHDVGLVRVKDEIQLSVPIAVFSNLRRNNPLDLFNTNIKVCV